MLISLILFDIILESLYLVCSRIVGEFFLHKQGMEEWIQFEQQWVND
jgi:hypothetical protein